MELQLQSKVRRWMRRVSRRVYPPAYVLGRVACLGQEVFNRLGPPHRNLRPRHSALLNMQKVRCDLLLEEIDADGRSSGRTRADRAISHLARMDVTWLIEQQERLIWLDHHHPVAFAVMDSFAELTDQQFRHRKEGWSFTCHYTDLNHTPEFDVEFECLGLLSVEQIPSVYERFFEWFGTQFSGVPLYFLQFPAALDSREAFKERAAIIRAAVESLTAKHTFVFSLSLLDNQVVKAASDDFAYHFAGETFDRFASLLEAAHASC